MWFQIHVFLIIILADQPIPVTNFKEDQSHWRTLGDRELKEALGKKIVEADAKNVVLFIGDGLGPTTTTSARIYGKGECGYLAWEKFRNVGVLKTYSANKLVPDSCSTATALFSGVKANHKTSGVDATVEMDDCEASLNPQAQLETIFNWAIDAGKSTGFVTTTRVTHATPSALFAHTPNRAWECESKMPKAASKCKDIARQLIEDYPGNNIQVIMGGGRQCLQSDVVGSDADPIDTWSCYSRDGRDLITDWIEDKRKRHISHQLLENNDDLEKADLSKEYTLGIFANGHLKMDFERDRGPKGMPSLTNMTEKTIQLLRKNTNGYILVVEGGLIDQAHHRGKARKALDETVAFSDAVERALQLVDLKETLVIVTSDHAHSMVLTGYPDRGKGVLSHTLSAMDNKPFTSLLYGTGGPNNYQFDSSENGTLTRRDPSKEDTEDFEYSQQAVVLTDEVTHAGTDVWVFAEGPMAHLFTTVHEQSYVAYVISYAAKIGPYTNKSSIISINACTFIVSTLVMFTLYVL